MLTHGQRTILQGILKFYDTTKRWPTPTDVSRLMNVVEQTAYRAYDALIARGYLTRTGHGRYRLVHPQENALDVLQYICETMARHGYCPTNRELSERLGLNETAIGLHVRSLENMGYIRVVHDEFGRYFEIRRFR